METNTARVSQDERFIRAATAYAPAIERFARGYEVDADLRRDLVQEVHAALWRSFAGFDGRCSERTWVYRVAHNVGADYVRSRRRVRSEQLVDLDHAIKIAALDDVEAETGARQTIERLSVIIRKLRPADRQVILLYLDDLSAGEIAEITGLTSGAVAARIHRIKALLAQRFASKEPS